MVEDYKLIDKHHQIQETFMYHHLLTHLVMVTIHINHFHFLVIGKTQLEWEFKKKPKEREKEKDFYADQTVPSIQF